MKMFVCAAIWQLYVRQCPVCLRRHCGFPVGMVNYSYFPQHFAPVAQLDRAPDYGFGGWGFDSLRARHFPFSGVPINSQKPTKPL